MKCFIDTNVLVDILLVRAPYYEAAATLLSLADDRRMELVVSTLSIANAHYICCERAKMPLAMWKAKISGLAEMMDYVALEQADIQASCQSEWNDFEDGLQHFTAKRIACDYIITRNAKDFLLSDIAVLTPEEALDALF